MRLLVCGGAGCGKTLLAIEFLVRGGPRQNGDTQSGYYRGQQQGGGTGFKTDFAWQAGFTHCPVDAVADGVGLAGKDQWHARQCGKRHRIVRYRKLRPGNQIQGLGSQTLRDYATHFAMVGDHGQLHPASANQVT